MASSFGNDPKPAITAREAGQAGEPAGSSPAGCDRLVSPPRSGRAGGSTNGAALAAQMVKFRSCDALGLVSSPAKLHTVYGRQYA